MIGERQLYRHRTRAGFRLGAGKTIDLLKYTAWLVTTRHAPQPEPAGDSYGAAKDRARARNAALSVAGRDIGELPAVGNPERRAKAELDFRAFCDGYFPQTFCLPWSDDHLRVLDRIEQAVLRGGLYALAMPRGSGKSSIAECACLWAVLFGHREFVCLIGSDEGHAADMLDAFKTELEGNDRLFEDFPEVCHPIRALDGIANRCGGQLCNGERTHIGWTAKEIVLPTMAGSRASGAIVKVAGLTGRIRGMKSKRPDDRTVRPTLVVLDDPQTDESTRSASQCAARESILAGAVLGLAGPGSKISGIMPCTVIRPNDMADSILDRDKHPEWNGERTKMVYRFPTDEKLWKRYAEIRADSFRAGREGAEATEFYRENREAMDAGATVAWPARFDADELSAVQNAMNLRLRDEDAFFAEYQNEPRPARDPTAGELTPDRVAAKINRRERGRVPLACTRLTAFVDIHATLLYWIVCAWEDDFTGCVLDYGTWPDQHRPYFALREADPSLALATGAAGLEGTIYQGLLRLTDDILGREWLRDDGAHLKVERCPIDANWGSSTDVVYQFCRESEFAGVLMPSHGRFVGASGRPFAEYTDRPGDRAGTHWRIPGVQGKREVRHLLYDANFWKSFVAARLNVLLGDRGCLSLFGDRPGDHRLLAEHLCAEYRVRTEGRGRVVDEWKVRPGGGDNHWLDCLAGSAAAAAVQGCALREHAPAKPKGPKRKIDIEQLYREARAREGPEIREWRRLNG